MRSPNFFIIGAQKSGTTSLHEYLSQHPDVFMSRIKEPAFFSLTKRPFTLPAEEDIIGRRWYASRQYPRGLAEYLLNFAEADQERIVGESSAEYLYYKSSGALFDFNPEARIVILLRNPVDRAYSAYTDLFHKLSTLGSFEHELSLERKRIENRFHYKWHFLQTGYYAHQVEDVLRVFPSNQVKVILFEDLIKDPLSQMQKLCTFLKIDPSFYRDFEFKSYNISGFPKNPALARLLIADFSIKKWVKALLPNRFLRTIKSSLTRRNLEKRALSDETRHRLTAVYENDIKSLEEILDRDLTIWKGASQ